MPDTEAPEITAADIRRLLGDPAEEPVLYIEWDEDTFLPGGIDVRASAQVPHQAVVLTRSEVVDALGREPSTETARGHPAGRWETVEGVSAALNA